MDKLIEVTRAYVAEYMQQFDASHDFHHIQRVFKLAKQIEQSEQQQQQNTAKFTYNSDVITLAALLHDIGDHKYAKEGEDVSKKAKLFLLENGADEILADKVQIIATNVSYSSEIRNPENVKNLIVEYPELAVVQDADRLDAIGAVGIGRCFTFGGARKARSMDVSVEHFEEKLVKLEKMMKTETGRRLAAVKTQRIREFQRWWEEETA